MSPENAKQILEELVRQPEVEAAAMVVHLCRFDPLVVICGYEGARRLEAEDFDLATTYRLAVATVIGDAQAKANKQ